ncbi:MAG: zinc ribbon domain-containing protein [Candidatus Heimdallarchaeota archaeon]
MANRNTWFGFGMTQKQAVWVFVLAIIGICVISFALFTMCYSLFTVLIYFDPYFYSPSYFFRQFLVLLPYILFFGILMIFAIYTAVKCRRIAKFHSRSIDYENYNEVKKVDQNFCPNCGQNRLKNANFCNNCGYKWV